MTDQVPVFLGQVDSRGRIVLDRTIDYGRWLQRLAGQRVELIVRKRRAQRSNQANAYYWSVVVALIADHCGYDPEEAHEALKLLFLTDHTTESPLPKVRSTASLNTAEFQDYLERVRRWAATDLGVDIPEPNEVAA